MKVIIVLFSFADLRNAKLHGANLQSADFTGAEVDPDLANYLTSKGISGFVVVE